MFCACNSHHLALHLHQYVLLKKNVFCHFDILTFVLVGAPKNFLLESKYCYSMTLVCRRPSLFLQSYLNNLKTCFDLFLFQWIIHFQVSLLSESLDASRHSSCHIDNPSRSRKYFLLITLMRNALVVYVRAVTQHNVHVKPVSVCSCITVKVHRGKICRTFFLVSVNFLRLSQHFISFCLFCYF